MCAAVLIGTGAAQAQDKTASQALAEAVTLFDQGHYVQAKEILLGIDPNQLTDEERARRQEYLTQSDVAATMSERALRDIEDAETAAKENDHARATELLQRVLENKYAHKEVKAAAESRLRELNAASQPGEEATSAPAMPAAQDIEQAASLTRQGDEQVATGNYDEAEKLYMQALSHIPGHPEATAGLVRIDQHRQNVSGDRAMSLPDQIRRDAQINWQRTEFLYAELKAQINRLVASEAFEEARQVFARARQVVESGRQFAEPLSLYETLRADVEALERLINDREREFHWREVERIRREVEEQRNLRQREQESKRRATVDSLFAQARAHVKDGDYESAIRVLEQILVIDPRNQGAEWALEEYKDHWAARRTRQSRYKLGEADREILIDVEDSKIPINWQQELNYPKNWLEVISRPERQKGSTGPLDAMLLGKLDRTMVPLDFDAVPFREAMERFADAYQVNIEVNWKDVQAAGIDPATPITLKMPQEVTLKKALSMTLNQVEGVGADLGYVVQDGVLTVATQHWLDHENVYQVAYPIEDLLSDIPQFGQAPTVGYIDSNGLNVDQLRQDQKVWWGGAPTGDAPLPDDAREVRVLELINLIQDQIAPESWRERNGSIGTITEFNGQLVVTQNSAAQERVSNLLDKLREQRSVQVAVEARFLTVQSNFLEEFGIDLDLVLNAGNAGFDFIRNQDGAIASDPALGSRLLLPRQFSRYGFLPNVPGGGNPMANTSGDPEQPFTNPALVPARSGGGLVGGKNMTPVPSESGLLDITNPTSLASAIPGTFAGRDIQGLSIFGSFLDNIQVDFLIRATQANARTSLLTAPKLVLTNGQRSWVAVVTSHAFVSQLQPVVAGGAAAQAPQTQTVNEGAVLDVQATVSADRRYVTMTLRPGVGRLNALETFQFAGANLESGAGFVQLPSVTRQVLNTTVNVPDGGTLLIGGQKLATEIEVDAGVPVLSKIPLLKRLYSSRSMVKDEQVLLILIKPKIIIPSEQEQLAFPLPGGRG
ncbi:MAG: general secretion pathway protein GspD [Planctomycetota bacterium]|nr:MAG: general secretion pathway protein GspD [Planctomycetota bacterium]